MGRPVALVSAGSGASPLMAMLRTLAVTAPETDIAWFHVARTPDEAAPLSGGLVGGPLPRTVAVAAREPAERLVDEEHPLLGQQGAGLQAEPRELGGHLVERLTQLTAFHEGHDPGGVDRRPTS